MGRPLGIIILITGVIILIVGAFSGILIPFGPRTYTWIGPIIGLIVITIGGIIASMGEREGFRPDNKTLKIADHHPCPVCGKQDYTWGVVGGPQPTRFRIKTFGPVWSGKPVMARTCDNCGNLNLFIKPEK